MVEKNDKGLNWKALFIAIFLSFSITLSGFAQRAEPVIDTLIRLITPTCYAKHFDSLQTTRGSSRKVIESDTQLNDHDACRDYLFRQFRKYLGKDNCYLHKFRVQNYGGLTNVIGYKKGRSPWKGIIVVSAHYDTNNNLDRNPGECRDAPGANDNGTGLAALLEIVRIISSIETEKSVLFAAWDFEEQFIYGYPTGSNEWYKQFISNHSPTRWKTIGNAGTINKNDLCLNINFDMFGRPNDSINGIPLLWTCSGRLSHAPFVMYYTETLNRYLNHSKAVFHGKMIYSDHYTFANRNVPAVENLESGYRKNPYYHTCSDHKDQPGNVSYEFALDVTQAGLAFLLEEAGLIRKPGRDKPDIFDLINLAEHPANYVIQKNKECEIIGLYSLTGKKISLMEQGGYYSFEHWDGEALIFQILYQDEVFFKLIRLPHKKDPAINNQWPISLSTAG